MFSVIELSVRSSSCGSVLLHALALERRHVLDDRAGLRERGRDHRLGLLVEVDQLGVAAVLEVAEAVVASRSSRRRRSGGGRDRPRASSCRCPTGRTGSPRRRCAPTLAEQCIDRRPCVRQQEVADGEDRLLDRRRSSPRGRRRGRCGCLKSMTIAASERQPSRSGSQTKRRHVEHRPAPRLDVLHALQVLGEHVVREHRVRRVLADEAVRHRQTPDRRRRRRP